MKRCSVNYKTHAGDVMNSRQMFNNITSPLFHYQYNISLQEIQCLKKRAKFGEL